jgi:acetyl-CoA carboxylase/biotin carboxylase 1
LFRPSIFDPSELSTDVTGKVVCKTTAAMSKQGSHTLKLRPKMIMPIKASESRKIIHDLSPGSVISAGDLLASLDLKDPSKVKKIESFTGELDMKNVPVDASAVLSRRFSLVFRATLMLALQPLSLTSRTSNRRLNLSQALL